jgi:hypothetical protein
VRNWQKTHCVELKWILVKDSARSNFGLTLLDFVFVLSYLSHLGTAI